MFLSYNLELVVTYIQLHKYINHRMSERCPTLPIRSKYNIYEMVARNNKNRIAAIYINKSKHFCLVQHSNLLISVYSYSVCLYDN